MILVNFDEKPLLKTGIIFLIRESVRLNVKDLYVYTHECTHTHHWHVAALVVIPNSRVFHIYTI